jgi:hypothetical protein
MLSERSARRTFDEIGIQIPQVYLPASGIDLAKWAVVACDQYTSEPEYWRRVEQIVGDSPSTLHLVLPEIYLGTPQEAEKTRSINAHMQDYLEQGQLVPQEGIFYVERQFGDRLRRGILLCLDLERYDFRKGSQSLIRATEGTIINRLPPRMQIRENAILEVPHILVLIDDAGRSVIEPLADLAAQKTGQLVECYDFELMLGSGHLNGYRVADPQVEVQLASRRASSCLPWVTATTRWRPPRPSGRRSSRRSAWITRPAMRWWRSRTSTMMGWISSPSTGCCSM